MVCKLCHKEGDLLNSHIIPEFIYKPLYDEKHRFHVISTYKQEDRKKEQKGIREKMLCSDCEQHISRYENYARKVLFGGVSIAVRKEDSGMFISGIDYKCFKLFQLSILWRASVSEPKMFKAVDLGPHAKFIRQMIISDDPGLEEKYCCVMTGIRYGSDAMSGFIDQPEKLRLNGQIAYRFIFGSIAWIYLVASHGIPKLLREFVLTESGRLNMALKDVGDMDCVIGFAKEARRMGRLPNDIA